MMVAYKIPDFKTLIQKRSILIFWCIFYLLLEITETPPIRCMLKNQNKTLKKNSYIVKIVYVFSKRLLFRVYKTYLDFKASDDC